MSAVFPESPLSSPALPPLPPRWAQAPEPLPDPLDGLGLPPATVVRDADLNNGYPATWSDAVAPGGMVCARPDAAHPDGICGMPVESEPCDRHEPPATATPGQAAYEAHAAMVVPRPWRWDQLDGKLRAAWEAAAQAAIEAASEYEPGSFGIGPGETIIAEFPVAAAPELAAALAETAYVRDVAGTLIGLFRDSRSDGWRARTSGARLKRLAHEAGLPAPDPARRENQALTAYEELDGAFAAALETVDALDADNARLAAELSACRQNNAAIAVQLDQYRDERDEAREACDRLRREALKRYGMVPSWVKSALVADDA